MPKRKVAVIAEKRPDLAGVVAVIDAEPSVGTALSRGLLT
jgi:hypothetical protein